ncbi:hypothetical protein COT69_00540 [candidate division WWE3 bacterium CG09_land_8_20_14_0_10_39_24]|uniref:Mannosyl-glycoprotein endo-beta-N-acetylglucosamidase-like domain-containing protein n=2 Tax=Katanobacteria TaxID=422282 RepID=A0A2G9XBL5_UNCKA|nr:MAG: hypothetical protein AUJ94_02950 [bacterium CG2_30_40_12]OJI09430.1 MAG: hypothetical protein BK003_00525 [bacterium CG09_39_24]PIP04354.1 MAG: hypothetical protein COX53_02910 [candidate division WWE3 bacterium CG23_combo_of_CG06-09_8_20_14_all_40_14]PIS13093.1 MAG: hypothetical protein COT69_00540 [candidate division WWE3 bacterium CG09_land_8_20_14_0_10_39_24]PJE50912.1 MAG: hypothetical protein COV27_02395 [candidate division WWE3 bacterium CG10_big_fil_rev_8_21_14_0_10_39_14]
MINMQKSKILFLAFPFFFFFTLAISVILGLFLLLKTDKTKALASGGPELYSLFASKPRVLGTVSQSIESQQATTEVIKQFMLKYHASSELVEHAETFKQNADKYNLNPWLVVAIGMCEGNLGRATPKFNGEETYNTWGWAASERDLAQRTGMYDLESWEKAIETVTKGLATSLFYRDYATKQVLTLEDIENIMRFYAPPSVLKGGPWSKCVWQYYTELENFNSAF